MEYHLFKNIKEKPSLLGLGCMRLPRLAGGGADEIDFKAAKALVDKAIAGGVTYFDTGYMYHGGACEGFVGGALAEYERGSYMLAAKAPLWLALDENGLNRIFEEQLRSCRTDYFDFYLIHAVDTKQIQRMRECNAYENLLARKKRGQIRNLGFSFHDSPPVLKQLCAMHRWDFCQIQLNYLDWTDYHSGRQYEILEENELPCIVMEPLHGGLLADLGAAANAALQKAAPARSIASWGIRYAASLPNVLTVLSGMSSQAQLEDNLHSFSPFSPLAAREKKALEKALAAFRQSFFIPCTNCRYCMPCPVGVNIPLMFSAYSTMAADGGMELFKSKYEYVLGKPNAGSCVACGKCAARCPQHINIPSLLKQIDSMTEPHSFKL
jgi:predicted aldo/keto reductase-like oxidoreductase